MFKYVTRPQKGVKSSASRSVQRKQTDSSHSDPDEIKASGRMPVSWTGLPDIFKEGINLDDAQTCCVSPESALSYARDTDTNAASEREKRLPQGAWNVVQQKQSKIIPDRQINGIDINYDKSPKREGGLTGQRSMPLSYMTPQKAQSAGSGSSVVQCASDWKSPSLEDQTKNINSRNPDFLQRVIHHMVPRKLLVDFCKRLTLEQGQEIMDIFATVPKDKRSSPHRILQSLHSNLIVGPEASNRIDDDDHIKGDRAGQQYFFDPTGGPYAQISEIYRQVFEMMNVVVSAPPAPLPCPQKTFVGVIKLLQNAEELYRRTFERSPQEDFTPEALNTQDVIWRTVLFKQKPLYVKRSDEYIIIINKFAPPFYVREQSEHMNSEGYDTEYREDKDLMICTQRVSDDHLDAAMERLSDLIEKQDSFVVKGIL